MTDSSDFEIGQWRSLSDGRIGLEFSAQGWAMVEVCALLGEFPRPQDLIQHMLEEIFRNVDQSSTRLVATLQWRAPPDSGTALLVLPPGVLEEISKESEMDVGELQTLIQSSIEMSLVHIYKEHGSKQRLH